MRIRRKRSLSILLAFLLTTGSSWTIITIPHAHAAPGAPEILYVKEGGAGLKNGKSWNNAFANLQDALDAADTSSGKTYEIWIAAGTYVPTKNNSPMDPSDIRERHFELKNGVTVLGGFPKDATDGVGKDDRNPELHQTILSGDLNGDDDPNDPTKNRSDNAYHVFYHPASLGMDQTAVLDGVTITGGNADYIGTGINTGGPGMLNVSASPTLRNVRIIGNFAINVGGGIDNDQNSRPVLQNVIIANNSAVNHGGGIFNRSSNPILENVVIVNNRAEVGGGMYSLNGSPEIRVAYIADNHATSYGGGFEFLGGTPILENVIILNNTAGISGGGIDNYYSDPELTNVVIAGNAAGEFGGGVNNEYSKPIFSNVSIYGNRAKDYGGGINNTDSEIVLKNVTISGNYADTGGGIYQLDNGKTKLYNSIVWGNLDLSEAESNFVNVNSPDPEIYISLVGPPFTAAPDGVDVNEISAQSLFVAPESALQAPTLLGNYRLKRTSVAVNGGDNGYVTDPNGKDVDGFDRIVGNAVDLGAYEYQGLWKWPPASQLTVSDVTTDGMRLSWPQAAGIAEFEGYHVYVNGQQVYEGTDLGLSLSGLADATVYQVEVYPYDLWGYEHEGLQAVGATKVAAPVAHPAGGRLEAGSLVTLSASAGTTIYYTTDLTIPTTSSRIYTEPIQLLENTTIQAIAVKPGHPDSDMLTASYTVYPAPPLHLTGIADHRSVTLGWTASPGSVTYAVYQYAGSSAPADPNDWVLIASGISSTQYTVTGLVNGTPYTFAVAAVNAEGSSSLSNVFTAVPSDKVPPQWPANSKLNVSEITRTSVKLAWPEASDNDAVTQYKVYVDGIEKQSVTGSVYEWTVTGLKEGTRYTFAVKALDASDNESVPLEAQAVTLPPADTDDSGGSGGPGAPKDPIVDVKPGNGGGNELPDLEQDQGIPETSAGEPQPTQEQPELKFSDIQGHWAEDFILEASAKSLVQGYPDGTFRPDQSITRAEFAVILARVLQLQGEGGALPFIDQDSIGDWAKTAIALAVEAGLFSGYDDGYFRPNQPITRAEIAVVIARALGLDIDSDTVTGFADDSEIPTWAKGAVEALRVKGVLEGRGDSMFDPNETATRAEAVVLLLRLLEILEK